MANTPLVLAVLAAGVTGAGAAVATSLALRPPETADASAAIAERLERIETAVAKVATAQVDSRRDLAQVSERLTGLQVDLGSARAEMRLASADELDAAGAADPAEGGRSGRAKRPVPVAEQAEGAGGVALHDGKLLFDRLGGAGGRAVLLDRQLEGLDAKLKGLSKGIQLRLLPEDERWAKAKEELGLQDYQVENLKRAVAERDAAMKDAMQVETSGEGEGALLRISRMDPEKAAAVQSDYDRKVSEALDADQRKKWDENGYGHAFGGPGGSAHVSIVTSVRTLDRTGSDAKDDGK